MLLLKSHLLLSKSYLTALIYVHRFNIQLTISDIRLPVFTAVRSGYGSLKLVLSFRTLRHTISRVLSPEPV